MANEILDNVYLIEVPLPDNPLKNLNSYFIQGGPRNLLIDTGFYHPVCYEALKAGLEEVGAEMENTDVFITHLHADHSGLCQKISSGDGRIFISETDMRYLRQMDTNAYWDELYGKMFSFGVPERVLAENRATNPAMLYRPRPNTPFTPIHESYVLEVGQYRFEVISTPGHTPGHLCLYDRSHKILFSGDHVIFDITPNIAIWPGEDDSLGDYLTSLNKIREYDIAVTLSAHRAPIGDCMERIGSLLHHHANRLDEALRVVERYPEVTAYTVASHMTWSIRAKNWEAFPPSQKWFATGETLSHLEYLFARNRIEKTEQSGQIVYRKK